MADRDVKLIIRAKNEASRAIDSVSDALKVLTDAQSKVSSGASKTDNAIGSLGDELAKMNSRIAGMQAMTKLAGHLDQAAQGVTRLRSAVTDATANFQKYSSSADQAGARVAELEAATAALKVRLEQEKVAQEAARAATSKTAAAQKELTAARREYNKAVKVKPDVAGRDDGIAQAKARLDAAQASVLANKEAHEKLRATYRASKKELTSLSAALREAVTTHKQFQSSADGAAAALERQQASLAKGESEYAQLDAAVKKTAAGFGVMEKEQSQLAAATSKLLPEVTRLGAALGAMQRYSDGSGGFADPKTAANMRANSAAIAEAEARLKSLRTAYAALNASTQLGKSATAQQKVELQSLATAADHAERELLQLRGALDTVAGGMRGVRSAGAGMFAGINRESRQAMSVFQRLRGEVLALATAYVGLYGTITNIGGVLTAYQQLEAAQNRLGAVFAQDDSKVAQELGFIERQAARLGIEFGSLANQYSKFAVSAQAANFSNEETRRVFLSVAEAGRVNKLSLEDMNGIFLALTQMIQKGRISSEELRQQLGERLPGAVNIMADALGVTTSQLAKMMEQGEVLANSSNLLKFATELDRRFGGQLQKSLQSTTTQLGKFWNNLYQAQLRVAEGGFIESFNELMADMNAWFQSREGRDFFLSLGAAAGKLMDGLRLLAENIDIIGAGIKSFIAFKAAAWMMELVGGLRSASAAASGLGANFATLTASQKLSASANALLTTTFGVSATTLKAFGAALIGAKGNIAQMSVATLMGSTALTTFSARAIAAGAASRVWAAGLAVLAGGLRMLNLVLVALGGPVGILITLGTLLAGNSLAKWATGVDAATSALDEHKRIMGEVLSAYDEVKGKTEEWKDAIENVTLDQANKNLRQMATLFEKARDQATSMRDQEIYAGMGSFGPEATKVHGQLTSLNKQFREGRITARQYRDALIDIYSGLKDDKIRAFMEGLLENARAAEEASDNYSLAAETASLLGSTLELVATGLGVSTKRAKDAAEASREHAASMTEQAEAASAVDESIKTLKEAIPELARELKQLEEQTDLNKAAWEGLVAAFSSGNWGKIGEIFGLWGRASKANQDKYMDTTPLKNSIDMNTDEFKAFHQSIKGRANLMSSNPGLYGDPSSTAWQNDNLVQIKTASGKTAQVHKASAAAFAGFVNELEALGYDIESIGGWNYRNKIAGKSLSEHAFGNAIDINPAKNPYGKDLITDMPHNISAIAAKYGLSWGGDWKSVKDAMHFEFTGMEAPGTERSSKAYLAEQEQVTDEKRKQNDLDRRAQEATDKALADLGFENDMLEKKMAGKDREVFIEEELRRLREQNPNISAAELAQAEALLNKKWDMQKALTAEKDERKEIKEIERQINDLETQRNALLAQRQIYEENGDTEKLKEVDAQLGEINKKLLEGINSAIVLLEALGGEGADAAIAKFKTLALEIGNADVGGKKFAMTAAEMSQNIFQNLEGGIISAFQTFAQAVANGENAIEALGNAFRQFAANFLLEIAQMIIKQTLFNALQQFSKTLGGGLFNFLGLHTGGVVGASGGGTIKASPAWFNNAIRYHSGGVAGLAPDEMPAILRVGEEVLTETDPRHRNNGGTSPGKGTKVINMFDAPSFLSEALNSKVGEETLLNFVRANPGAFKAALG